MNFWPSIGCDIEKPIEGAKPDKGRDDGYNADPSDPIIVCRRKADGNGPCEEQQANDEAQASIDNTDIGFHDLLPFLNTEECSPLCLIASKEH